MPGKAFLFLAIFMFYIYILYSERSNIYYTGYTSDFVRRLLEHNSSIGVTFTSKHRPWMLKAVFSCSEVEAEAIRIERFIKKQKSKNLIERMIEGDVLHGPLAQLVRVPQVRD